MYYMREIAEAFNGEAYSTIKSSNKYLKDWHTVQTGDTPSDHKYNIWYLRKLVKSYDPTITVDNLKENQCLRIIAGKVTPPTPVIIGSVSLTASPTTITTEESTVLTATVLDDEDNPVRGRRVIFYDGASIIDDDITDVNGVATATFNSQTTGNHTISATTGNVTSSSVTVTVEGITPAPTPTTLTWTLNGGTSTSAILSHKDGDEAVFVFTVLDENDDPYEGYQIPIEVNGTAVSPTLTTGSDGTATYTYESQGIGDVDVEVDCSLLSETFVIQDCDYNADSTKIASWNNVSSEGSSFKVSDYSIGLSSFSVEMKFNTIDSQIMVGNQVNWLTGLSFLNPYLLYTHSSTGGTVTDNISNPPISTDVWRIEVEGTTIRAYRNDNLLFTHFNCKIDYPKSLRIYPQNAFSSVDYVRVKPL